MSSKKDLIQYHAQSLFGPTKDALVKATKAGYLRSFPGLTIDLINKHLPPEPATAKGHQKHRFKGLRSTKKALKQHPKDSNPSADYEPNENATLKGERTNYVKIKILDLQQLTYSDQTGHFPVTSS